MLSTTQMARPGYRVVKLANSLSARAGDLRRYCMVWPFNPQKVQ